MNSQGTAGRLVNAVAWSAAGRWTTELINLGIFLILARVLAPDHFGLLAMAWVVISLLGRLRDHGLSDAIVQVPNLEDLHLQSAFWLQVGLGSVLSILGVAMSGIVSSLYDEPRLAPVLMSLSLVVALASLSGVHGARMRRELDFRSLGIALSVSRLAGGGLGIMLALRGFGVWSLVAQQVGNAAIEGAIVWMRSGWRPRWAFSWSHSRELLSFGLNVTGFSLVNFVNRESDNLLVGYFLGPIALGYYAVAYRILIIFTNLVTRTASAVAFPGFSAFQGDERRLLTGYLFAVRLAAFVGAPFFIGLALIAEDVIIGFVGPQWSASVGTTRVLCFIGLLHSVIAYDNPLMMAKGKPNWIFGLGTLNAILNCAGFILALVVFEAGFLGVAIAYTVRGYLMWPIQFSYVRRLIPIRPVQFFGQFLVPFLSVLGMALVVFLADLMVAERGSAASRAALLSVLGAGTYGGLVALMAPDLLARLRDLCRKVNSL